MLTESVLDGHVIKLDQELNVITSIEISGSKIMVLVERAEDGFRFHDLFDSGMHIFYGSESAGSTTLPAPILFALSEDDLRLMANIDSPTFRLSCNECIDNAKIAEYGCNKLVEMLNAYDKGAVCSKELLECCEALSERLAEYDNSSEIYEINRMQTRLRKGSFGVDEKSRVEHLAANTSDKKVRAAANILLGNFTLARKTLESLPKEESVLFESWPIFRLMNSKR